MDRPLINLPRQWLSRQYYAARDRAVIARAVARAHLLSLRGYQVIHALHISKTGGTALFHVLRETPPRGRRVVFLHQHYFTLRHVPKGHKVLFFLRDPISRFHSGFNFRKRKGQPTFYRDWSATERAIFERWHTSHALAEALGDPETHTEAARAVSTLRILRHGYEDWLDSAEYLAGRREDVFFVGMQERLEDDAAALFAKLGLPDGTRLPSDPVTANRAPEEARGQLSDRAEQALRHWYRVSYDIIRVFEDDNSAGRSL